MAETNAPGLNVNVKRVFRYAFIACVYVIGVFWSVVWICSNFLTILRNPTGFFTVKKRAKPPAVLQDPALGEHGYLHLKNGIRIHYVASGPPDAPLMLFLHGFPEFFYTWRHQIRYFKNSYRVVAVDLRGYGDSSKPSNYAEYEIRKLCEDVRLIIQSLQRASCILVGHDWGGMIAWNFGSLYPEMVSSMVVINAPHPAVFWKFAMKNPKQLLMSWYIFMFQLPFLPEFFLSSSDLKFLEEIFTVAPMGAKPGTYQEEDIEAFKYTFSSAKAFTAPINYYRNLFRFNPPKPIKFQPLPFPILVIFGTGDRAISPETALLSGQFAGGIFELKYVEGASHWVNEEEPEVVNNTIAKFLSDH
ncbi:epoxide hydrolase 4-like [Paramacrobiotus metropolitanus]|uniref:epoxide hydrolase 4-like n=1 Tax=Paramacrobiotus metropolitanus TaxID=2943436 RepID=UPI002445FAA9|nr:epoxide hydrolase 4-like [Paramacrobiotus metropolitanus]